MSDDKGEKPDKGVKIPEPQPTDDQDRERKKKRKEHGQVGIVPGKIVDDPRDPRFPGSQPDLA